MCRVLRERQSDRSQNRIINSNFFSPNKNKTVVHLLIARNFQRARAQTNFVLISVPRQLGFRVWIKGKRAVIPREHASRTIEDRKTSPWSSRNFAGNGARRDDPVNLNFIAAH